MKVRIFSPGCEEPEVHSIDILELDSYVDFLKKNGMLDVDGIELKVDTILYDIHQNAVDITCEEAG